MFHLLTQLDMSEESAYDALYALMLSQFQSIGLELTPAVTSAARSEAHKTVKNLFIKPVTLN